MAKQPKVVHGSIVWAEVNDPITGQPAGEHPTIVLSTQANIDAGKDLRVVVISTSYKHPVSDGWYEMPHTPGKPGGHEKTGLDEACVAKATWPQRIPQSTIRIKGKHRAPAKIVRNCEQWLKDHRPPPKNPQPTTQPSEPPAL